MLQPSPQLDGLGLSLNPLKAAKQIGQWAVGKGNRPGTPESRKGVVAEDQLPVAQTSGSIGGMPMDQVVMLGGFALATLLLTQKKRRK